MHAIERRLSRSSQHLSNYVTLVLVRSYQIPIPSMPGCDKTIQDRKDAGKGRPSDLKSQELP